MDPSNSFESQASVNTNQPEQTETITCMDRDCYNAAAEGNIDFFENIINYQSLDSLLTPNKNTILHIYITALNSGSNSTTPNAGTESTTANTRLESIVTLNAGSESTTPNTGSKSTVTLDVGSESTTANTRLESIVTLNAGSESTTPNTGSKSTVTLDVGSESTTNFVEEILNMCPSLLWQANVKDETPLHIAARYGHDDIVKVLIKYCAQTLRQDLAGGIFEPVKEGGIFEPIKEMLRMENKDKDTALHEAVRYGHLKVVELLIKEDPDFSYSANDAGETPLYIAAERRFESVLIEILDKCNSPMHGGPLGRTALHAAVQYKYNEGMVGRILEKIDGISRKVDNIGWTPLHLAVYFDQRNLTKQLLEKDRKVTYMKDTKGKTPLHIAAQRGFYWMVEIIVKKCPDCCDLVDNRGWNVLHFAIKGSKPRYIERIMDIIIENWSFSNLLNEKNANGDTPLHFYATTSWESLLELKKFVSHPRIDKMAFNKQHLNAWDIALLEKRSFKEMKELRHAPRRVITEAEDQKKQKEKKQEKQKEQRRSMMQKAYEVHLVVATLIATVTFAACITMPGGFVGSGEGEGSHPGSVLLRNKAAFKVFVIADTISMVLSSSAVFIHLLMPFILNKVYDDDDDDDGNPMKLAMDDDDGNPMKLGMLAFKFILLAMIAMGLAFVTGAYAVLMPSFDIAFYNCIIGLTFFAILFWVFLNFLNFSFSNIVEILCPWKLD